ncbi:hypothetical protein A1O7_02827 [Cladophialophora yegresii CBS 114405]|uniref:Cyclin domain-containing protein n=1 Tax=Cladophialophora yegresii CBS 114405 TaxID=1182544 RepID=W9W2W1_9EURO|nr:uncharacterized protein A1O7_02827 [Cladophialophora yegresii CBS 114405]EXJ62392.1 hypothetical protein A1O7_02827 [Cladophialophora yegresii CBS 114405]
MAPVSAIEYLTNPLVTADQLIKLKTLDDEDAPSIRFAQFQLTSAAGILLQLSQEVIAHAIILLQRFLVSSRPGDREGFSHKAYTAASIHLAAKISATPVSPRSVINVYTYLMSKSSPLRLVNPDGAPLESRPQDYYVSEGTYERERQRLFVCESMILAGIGFDTRVALPYTLALTYMQALGVSSTKLAQRVFEHLNAGLLSPQLLYLTHQPNALAVGALYLAAREIGAKLVEQNWWEVFDVNREDLGFLVLSYGSVANFAEAEASKWKQKSLILD